MTSVMWAEAGKWSVCPGRKDDQSKGERTGYEISLAKGIFHSEASESSGAGAEALTSSNISFLAARTAE